MKPCSKCGETKPLTDYYRHPTGADGFTQICKTCKRNYSTTFRLKLIVESPEVLDRYRVKYVNKYPIKRAANVWVNNAVRDGRLIKEPCEICGDTYRVHGHHDDYSEREKVRWLCALHHKEWHIANGEAKNAA